jgi:DNA-binding NarL/FixJ family response regulator
MKVLIADDSEIIRSRIVKLLSGYQEIESIQEARDVKETIKKIHSSYPSVLILDVKMPDGNGIEVLDNISHDQHPPIVIVVTNYPFPEYKKEYMMAGADFFFDKSNEFRQMQKVIENLVDNEIRIKAIKRANNNGQNTIN